MAQGIKVLIIEDDPEIRRYFDDIINALFHEKVDCTFATNIEEARELFEHLLGEGLNMIFVDACLNSNQPNSMPLISHFRLRYQGPIFAMSCNQHYIYPLLRAGCGDSCAKVELPRAIDKYLRCEAGLF